MATVLTNGGKAIVTNRITGAGIQPTFVGWGTGAGTAAAADTDLFTPASEARVNGTASRVTTTVTNDTWQLVATMIADAGKTITNSGCFDGAGTGSPPTGGTLFIKFDFAGVALLTGEKIEITIKAQF